MTITLTAVQPDSARRFSAQQMAGQPDHKCAEPVSPAITIFEVVQQTPRFMELLTPEGVKALTATCKKLRQGLRCSVTTIQLTNQGIATLHADKWPSLVMVVVSSAYNFDQKQSGSHPESYLPKREWSTLMSLIGHQASTNDVSLVQQSVALVVRASHQSSQNLDTRAHDIALARLAKAWQGKTQSIRMYLNWWILQHMDPVKHLQTGSWPHLWFIIFYGNLGNALPISCFWGEGSSNVKQAEMSHCRLDAEAIQSLVTACPHLSVLTLAGCKLEAAALSCLNQACLSRQELLDLSENPQGRSGVRSLSSCHLPELYWLSLDDTKLDALAAMYLAQGQWPKLETLRLFDNQLNVEAVAYVVEGEWRQKLGLSWTCVPEAAFAVLGVADACKQIENKRSDSLHVWSVSLARSSFLVWPRLNALTVKNASLGQMH